MGSLKNKHLLGLEFTPKEDIEKLIQTGFTFREVLDRPIKNSLEILEVSKLISEQLDIHEQICLVNFIQIIWWRKTKNIDLVKKLENLKFLLRKNIQPRLAWEITFLKIAMEDI